jgi:uncharacterized membrane protein YphA (DoxX/SURF4 family)
MIRFIQKVDRYLNEHLRKYGHLIHRVSLGLLFVWFGLLKPLGHDTTTSLLAHTVFIGEPDVMVLFLGWWEVLIGVCLVFRPLVRISILLLLLRLPGIIIAFIVKSDVCFVNFPFAPTPEGQYLIKDMVIFLATLAIAGTLSNKHSRHIYH